MIQIIQGDIKHCICERCGYEWDTIRNTPTICPAIGCRSREWNGKKRAGRPPGKVAVELPSPKKVRL